MNTPPAEWPIRMGGESRPPTTASRCSMICGTVTFSIGVGSALSASTSTSNPGYAGASTRKPRCLVVGDPVLPAPGRDPEAVDQDDRVWSLRVGRHERRIQTRADGTQRDGVCPNVAWPRGRQPARGVSPGVVVPAHDRRSGQPAPGPTSSRYPAAALIPPAVPSASGCAAGARDGKAAPDQSRCARGRCPPRVSSTRQHKK